MTTRTITLCLATLAIGGFAFAAQDAKNSSQAGKSLPAANERMTHVYRVDKLKGLDLESSADKSVGDIDALIIDSGTGRIAYAIVAQGGLLGVGEDKRLVPWSALTFAPKLDKANQETEECVAHTVLTKEQIAACPAFKKGEPISAELERKAYDGAKLKQDPIQARGLPARLVCSEDIDGCKVRSKTNDELGKVERILIDPMEACVAYTVLEASGKHLALPWQVTEVLTDKDQKVYLATSLTKERMDAAPMYVEKEWKQMTSSTWLRDLATYHKCEPYWIHTTPASAGRSDEKH